MMTTTKTTREIDAKGAAEYEREGLSLRFHGRFGTVVSPRGELLGAVRFNGFGRFGVKVRHSDVWAEVATLEAAARWF
jgi:hypothetical protein